MNEKFEYVTVLFVDDIDLVVGEHCIRPGGEGCPYWVWSAIPSEASNRYVFALGGSDASFISYSATKRMGLALYSRQPVPPKKYRLTVEGEFLYKIDGNKSALVSTLPPGEYTITEGYEG